jgi:quercetin dioxygenase-like cupin family protein
MFGYVFPDEYFSEDVREAVQLFISQAKSYSYKAGQEIVRHSSKEPSVYHILSGKTACLSLAGQVNHQTT